MKDREWVMIEWVDPISNDDGWRKESSLKSWYPAICFSMGYIVFEDDKRIVIASSRGWHENEEDGEEDGEEVTADGAMALPWEIITRVRRMSIGKVRRRNK